MDNQHKQFDLESLISLMESRKVLRVKMGGMEVELSPSAFTSKLAEAEGAGQAEPIPTDDEFMRWSAAGAFVEPEEKAS